MIILDAEICFDKQSDNPEALSDDLNTKHILRPVINFGNDMLFSGTIKAQKTIEIIVRGETYNVIIEMPTIEQEAYEAIKSLLYVGGTFKIQSASRVIGKGKIIDFVFE